MTDDDFDASLIRTRRNLILISTLIFIHLSGAVTLNSEGNFAGIPIKLGNQSLVTIWLLIFNGYFLWRFFVYLQGSRLKHTYSNLLRNYIHIKIEKYMKATGEARVKEIRKTNRAANHASFAVVIKIYFWFCARIEAVVTIAPYRNDSILETLKVNSLIKFYVILTQNLKLISQDINFSEVLLPLLMGSASLIWLSYNFLNLSPTTLP